MKQFAISVCVFMMLMGGVLFAQKNQTEPHTRILFIFDASQSMWGEWQSDKKIHIANKLLAKMIDSLQANPDIELALRVYGHTKDFPPQDCDDTRLEVPFAPKNGQRIKNRLRSIIPRGTTPIAMSLEAAAADFPPTKTCRNVIILITDGIEECSGDPCAVSTALQEKGIVLKPFVIGLGKESNLELDCIGTYFDATSEQDFDRSLHIVVQHILNSTTAQVNLLDQHGYPTETNVAMSFSESKSGKERYNFVHTFNGRGIPDTLLLDPIPEYDLTVHTVPPVHATGIQLHTGKHTIISVDAPQGQLLMKTSAGSKYKTIPIIVRESGKQEILNVQYFDFEQKYIVGKYDIEILCLPRLQIKDVAIKQSHLTKLEVPAPGTAILTKPEEMIGSLFVVRNGQNEWIYDLNVERLTENILLQPGHYKIIYRPKRSYNTMQSKEREFKIAEGQSMTVQL